MYILMFMILLHTVDGQTGQPLFGPFTTPLCSCPSGTSTLKIKHWLDPDFNVEVTDSGLNPIPSTHGKDSLKCKNPGSLVVVGPNLECQFPIPPPPFNYAYNPINRVKLDLNNNDRLLVHQPLPLSGAPHAFVVRRLKLEVKYTQAIHVNLYGSGNTHLQSFDCEAPLKGQNILIEAGNDLPSGEGLLDVVKIEITADDTAHFSYTKLRGCYPSAAPNTPCPSANRFSFPNSALFTASPSAVLKGQAGATVTNLQSVEIEPVAAGATFSVRSLRFIVHPVAPTPVTVTVVFHLASGSTVVMTYEASPNAHPVTWMDLKCDFCHFSPLPLQVEKIEVLPVGISHRPKARIRNLLIDVCKYP